MKIVICGSTAFAKEMLEIKEKLEKSGFLVMLPLNIERFLRGEKIEKSQIKIESDVIRKYYEEINNSDAILILNKTKNNIENYVGGNALIEMAFAHVLNKKIFLLNPIPKMSYSEEIITMQPIILNGDLTKIAPE